MCIRHVWWTAGPFLINWREEQLILQRHVKQTNKKKKRERQQRQYNFGPANVNKFDNELRVYILNIMYIVWIEGFKWVALDGLNS